MSARKLLNRWTQLAVILLPASHALATGIDCNRIHDPIAQTICTHRDLLILDGQLSVAYTAALARDPSRADDLKKDEINWIGDRNREMWWRSAAQRQFPSLPTSDNALAHFYRLRIAFLRNVDNPDTTRDRPIAARLLAVAKALPADTPDVMKALAAAGIAVLSTPHDANTQSVDREISMLAAAPDSSLRKALGQFDRGLFTVMYLPSAGLGGAFTIEGTADCQYWVVFRKQGNATVPVGGQVGELSGTCTRDGGSTGYLALIDGHPVAINVTHPPAFPHITDLQWRRWLGGNRWSAPTRIRLRYGYALNIRKGNYCPSASPQCALTPALAMRAAQRYVRNPWGMDRPTAPDADFRQMQALAPGRTDWAECSYPVWFKAHLNGRLVVAGISESHLACHPGDGFLTVGFWGMRSDNKRWWSAEDTITAERTQLLTAALIPPSQGL